MTVVRNILAVIGAGTCLYTVTLLYGFVFPTPPPAPKDLFDWSEVFRTKSPDGKAEALVLRGVSNTGANTSDLYKVTLQAVDRPAEWLHSIEVWESQSRTAPLLHWQSSGTVVIEQEPSQLYNYEPELELPSGTYRVTLNVHYVQP